MTTKRIVVASKNPVKIQAALAGFRAMFPDEDFTAHGLTVASGVSDQPGSDTETYQGALNRATNAHTAEPSADFWVGLEGGVQPRGTELEAHAWAVVRGTDGRLGKGQTGIYFLPPEITRLLSEGKELGEATDLVFDKTNSKQASGTTGLLTGGAVDRTSFYTQAIIFALIPFKNPELY